MPPSHKQRAETSNDSPSSYPFSENLLTPHSEIAKSEGEGIRLPLFESRAFKDVRAEYTLERDKYDTGFETQVATAYAVGGAVRRTLRFASDSPIRPELSPEQIAEDGYTNCHGYTVVTSESLDNLDIPHWVGFANGHSFILLENDDWRSANIIDTPVRALYTRIDGAIREVSINSDKDVRGGAAWLDTSVVLQKSGFQNIAEAKRTRPWLEFPAYRHQILHRTDNEDKRAKNAQKLVLRFYPPEIGRLTLEAYSNLAHSIDYGEVNETSTKRAHFWMSKQNGTYPEIDRRNKLYGATQLVRQLGRFALVDEALQDIDYVRNSTNGFTEDLTIKLWPIDQIRKLGKQVGSFQLLDHSRSEYEELYEQRKSLGQPTHDITARLKAIK